MDHTVMSQPQVPAEGILKLKDHNEFKYFKVPCECGCDSEITFSIEVDEDNITAHFYSQTKTNYWRDRFPYDYPNDIWLLYVFKQFANDWYNRLAIVWNALFKGYVETESWVLLTEQQTVNLAEALKGGAEEFHIKREVQRAAYQEKLKAKNEAK
jgi:hypothetical protein